MEDNREQEPGESEVGLDERNQQLPVGHRLERLVGVLQVTPGQAGQQGCDQVTHKSVRQRQRLQHSA